ncbi:hydrogenase large subunit [Methylovirgula sp. 4M-Z18]|uniref:hydrogenase large subunit n=1 Tax=Methylovirgula sp. 4M-Z18 TaxID=2293567 RepID=UPI000E2E8458|nr:NADH-quinone oxidoreductase subunit C [Methylovirgula sp. 4M-Z18]RFB79950.1 hydrogenase expression protein HypE [Methylovirgula sp. 4M-Z18]
MPTFAEIVTSGQVIDSFRPWRRVAVTQDVWRSAVEQMVAGSWTLLALWGDRTTVYMAILDEAARDIAVLGLACPEGVFPSVGLDHPPALRLERALQDLCGLTAQGLPDTRPWLDHGRWPVRHPLGSHTAAAPEPRPYSFLTAEGEGLHQIPVGPVHAGIIEPGHFRFTANGETVVRLEERLGYVHKGIETLMCGATLDKAARLAGRASGDSTVAYAIAFARAVEAACGLEISPRATYLRALMAELERLANHLGDIGAICNDAAFALMHAHTSVLRERVLRTAADCFGHRLMMDRVVPGGVSVDLSRPDVTHIRDLLRTIRPAFATLIELYDNTASLQDRTVGTGIVRPALAAQYGAGGYIGRASGRTFDARRTLAYPPYDMLDFDVPVRHDGDVNARVWIRIREVEQSLSLIAQILDRLPEDNTTRIEINSAGETREGLALVEGFRGDILAWVRIDSEGRVERCHLRDPSWFQWPLLEAAIEGNIVADFPLCNKSFNCSYSGHDL